MKRLSWTMVIAALTFSPACGETGDDPAATGGGVSDGGPSTDAPTSDSTSSTSSGGGGGGTDSPTTGPGTAGGGSTSTTPPTGGSSGATDSGFIDPPDGGVVGQCDPGLQDCPNEDEKCTGFVTQPGECCVDANHCVPITGNKQFGEVCTRVDGDDDCAAGFFCMTKTSGSVGDGVCGQYCVVDDNTTCDTGGECLTFNDGALPICQTECDPLIQDCPSPQGCFAASDKFVCANPNLDQGGTQGDPCHTIQSCQPGNVCTSADFVDGCSDTACCSPWCDLTDASTHAACQGAEECTAWYADGEAPPGHEDVGACSIPQ